LDKSGKTQKTGFEADSPLYPDGGGVGGDTYIPEHKQYFQFADFNREKNTGNTT
jgi:hypothetical protein